MNYKSFNLGDWIGHISGVIEDESELDGNEMRDLVEFLSMLEQEPKWIPVTERLPEKEGEYLVSLVNETYMVSYFDGNRFWCLCEIDAWMPLPKPYEEGAEE